MSAEKSVSDLKSKSKKEKEGKERVLTAEGLKRKKNQELLERNEKKKS
jgi:hypothetical protein